MTFKGPWSKDKPYSKGDSVDYQGILYTAKMDSWGNSPPSASWSKSGDIVGKVVQAKPDPNIDAPEWSAKKPYDPGNLVKLDGIIYKSKAHSLGNRPPSAGWVEITKKPIAVPAKPVKPEFINDYAQGKLHNAGDIVKHDGKIYQAKSDNQAMPGSPAWQEVSKVIKETKVVEQITKDINANVIIVEQHGYDGKPGVKGDPGKSGKDGKDGVGLQFQWSGTTLQVKREDATDWTSVDLRGAEGESKVIAGEPIIPTVEVKEPQLVALEGTRFKVGSYTASGTSLVKSSSGRGAVLKSLVAGSNVTITHDANTVTIASTGGGGGSTYYSWSTLAGTSQALVTANGYIPLSASLTTFTLPSSAAVGDHFKIAGFGSGGWAIAQNAGQSINFGNQITTTGVTGSIASQNAFDGIELICVVANNSFVVVAAQGNMTVA